MVPISLPRPLTPLVACLALLGAILLTGSPPARAHSQPFSSPPAGTGVRLPLVFEQNRGQAPRDVRFLAHGSGYTLFLTESGIVLRPAHAAAQDVSISFDGARHPAVAGVNRLPGIVNYYIGNDSSRWLSNVPTFARVVYRNVYPHIDLVFHAAGRVPEYDWMVRPGGNPAAIRMRVDGAGSTRLLRTGMLRFTVGSGVLIQGKPDMYETIGGARRWIGGRYHLLPSGRIGFQVGKYDSRRTLIIDPTVAFSTYLGGSGADEADGVLVDSAGGVYVAGLTGSTNFPEAIGNFSSYSGGTYDAFVSRLASSGSVLAYTTFIGGSGDDRGRAIAVDSSGNAYVVGVTNSSNFPVVNPTACSNGSCSPSPIGQYIQAVLHGSVDAFVVKLDGVGKFVYSTYLGGSSYDEARGIAVDGSGNAYVTGWTGSADFPVKSTSRTTYHGGSNCGLASAPVECFDAFVTEIDPAGDAIKYSTYLGGNGIDRGYGIAVDGSGKVYVAGSTTSDNFPTANAMRATRQGTCGSGNQTFPCPNIWAAKLDPGTDQLIYSTYLGGHADDRAWGIAIDGSGDAYLTGVASSTDFPTKNAVQTAFGGGTYDAFVLELNPAGSDLVFSTYLGGSDLDEGLGIAVNGAGQIAVAGQTRSSSFPTKDAVQPGYGGGQCQPPSGNPYPCDDAFAALFAPGGSLVYSTYWGGKGDDAAQAVALDATGNLYMAGWETSSDFPTANALQRSNGGDEDAWVARINTPVQQQPPPPPKTKCPKHSSTKKGKCVCKKGYTMKKGKCVKKKK